MGLIPEASCRSAWPRVGASVEAFSAQGLGDRLGEPGLWLPPFSSRMKGSPVPVMGPPLLPRCQHPPGLTEAPQARTGGQRPLKPGAKKGGPGLGRGGTSLTQSPGHASSHPSSIASLPSHWAGTGLFSFWWGPTSRMGEEGCRGSGDPCGSWGGHTGVRAELAGAFQALICPVLWLRAGLELRRSDPCGGAHSSSPTCAGSGCLGAKVAGLWSYTLATASKFVKVATGGCTSSVLTAHAPSVSLRGPGWGGGLYPRRFSTCLKGYSGKNSPDTRRTHTRGTGSAGRGVPVGSWGAAVTPPRGEGAHRARGWGLPWAPSGGWDAAAQTQWTRPPAHPCAVVGLTDPAAPFRAAPRSRSPLPSSVLLRSGGSARAAQFPGDCLRETARSLW